MLPPHKPLLFVDSNVLIEGLLEDYATAKAIVVFARHGKLKLITCQQVVTDVENELIQQAKGYAQFSTILQHWQEMCKKINLKIVSDPPEANVLSTNSLYLPLMRHQADIPILAADLDLQAEFFEMQYQPHASS